jgi:hypothetical protein
MANGKWQMANGKWQMANGQAVVRAARLDLITTRFEAQGL